MSKTTQDHGQIRKWVEKRGAHPAAVKGTGGRGDPGILRIDFPGYSGKLTLKEISWDEFFKKFDAEGLEFLYQEKTKSGVRSNFNKLISAQTARRRASTGSRAGTRSSARSGTQRSATAKASSRRAAAGATSARAKKKTSKARATRRTTTGTGRRQSSR